MNVTSGQKETVRREAEANSIPCISRSTGNILELLVGCGGRRNIVEVGSGNGYSTLFLIGGAASSGGLVTTFEKDPARGALAENNLGDFIREGKAALYRDDAAKALERSGLRDVDFLFIDGMKRQYSQILKLFFGRLSKGALVFADDVFFKGVAAPEETLDRHRAIVRGLRDYLELIDAMEKNGEVKNYLFDYENGYSITVKL